MKSLVTCSLSSLQHLRKLRATYSEAGAPGGHSIHPVLAPIMHVLWKTRRWVRRGYIEQVLQRLTANKLALALLPEHTLRALRTEVVHDAVVAEGTPVT